MSYRIKSVSRALHCTNNEAYFEFRFYAYLMSKFGFTSPASVYFLFNPVYMNSTAQHVWASLYDLSINDCNSNWFILTQLILSWPKRCTFKKVHSVFVWHNFHNSCLCCKCTIPLYFVNCQYYHHGPLVCNYTVKTELKEVFEKFWI